jgi:hypothetical protein
MVAIGSGTLLVCMGLEHYLTVMLYCCAMDLVMLGRECMYACMLESALPQEWRM